MVALALRDLRDPVRQRHCLGEVLEPDLSLEVMSVDDRPLRGDLPAKLVDCLRPQRRDAAPAGDAISFGQCIHSNNVRPSRGAGKDVVDSPAARS